MATQIKKDFLLILFSIVLIIASAILAITTDYTFTDKIYYGIALLTISTVLYFVNKGWYIYVFGLVILIGLFDQIDFFIMSFGAGFGSFSINLLFLLLGLIFVRIHRDIFFPKGNEEQQEPDKSQVRMFKEKFKDSTESELEAIASENSKYVEAARAAAIELLRGENVL